MSKKLNPAVFLNGWYMKCAFSTSFQKGNVLAYEIVKKPFSSMTQRENISFGEGVSIPISNHLERVKTVTSRRQKSTAASGINYSLHRRAPATNA